MSCESDLTINRGNSKVYELAFVDSAGAPINISNYIIYFMVKRNKTDADSAALIKKIVASHTDAAGGLTEVQVSHEDTLLDAGNYYYEFKYRTPGDISTANVETIQQGIYTITQNVVNDIS